MAGTMPRHKRRYGFLFCGRLRPSQTTLGDERTRRLRSYSSMATSELGRAGDFLLRVVDGICNCFLALKSLPRVFLSISNVQLFRSVRPACGKLYSTSGCLMDSRGWSVEMYCEPKLKISLFPALDVRHTALAGVQCEPGPPA
jgi:hypothetical protein